ncbi:MAG: NAD(P)/FAD-dependent oxidoreductase [Longimicrobiales bacterium]
MVSPVAARRVMLVPDAAGIVSPVTAGGVHTALKHGLAAGHAVADFLSGKCEDPSDPAPNEMALWACNST